jgi:predicted chitinase
MRADDNCQQAMMLAQVQSSDGFQELMKNLKEQMGTIARVEQSASVSIDLDRETHRSGIAELKQLFSGGLGTSVHSN